MKSLDELIDRQQPGWRLVEEWLTQARNQVEVLPPVPENRGPALLETQVTTRSPMGAIIHETGGILVDHGWLRILGSGCARLARSVPNWNKGRTTCRPNEPPSHLFIADDVVGGFFAIDGGGLGLSTGAVCYFAPDSLEWECLDTGYSDFVVWAFSGDIATFYDGFRWKGWKLEVARLTGDQAISFYPFLWAHAPSIEDRHRAVVSVDEVFRLQQDFLVQMAAHRK